MPGTITIRSQQTLIKIFCKLLGRDISCFPKRIPTLLITFQIDDRWPNILTKGGWILILVALNFFLLPATHSRLCSLFFTPVLLFMETSNASIEQEIRERHITPSPSPVPSQDGTLGNSGWKRTTRYFTSVISTRSEIDRGF
ncbi:hypothetical protein CEXT_336631 [Caerostris extrusa]|uniref:Uncharacterized protein n=1 Tax=Caerostris extrusa TaxID=172846 RepID=A0AAV4XXM4_CAEEX|nr:hypothetical protein CEXT_336631 [Caerostris extrusa]